MKSAMILAGAIIAALAIMAWLWRKVLAVREENTYLREEIQRLRARARRLRV